MARFRPEREAAKWTLLALTAGHLAVDCCTGIWPVFKTLAGLDIAAAGLFATIGNMAGNGLQLAFGILADRGWRKRLIVSGVATAGAVTLAPWTVRSYVLMAVLVLVTQIGSAAFHPCATGAVGSISRTRTGFLIGVLMAGGYLGYSLSQVLFSAIYTRAPAVSPVIALVPLAVAGVIAARLPGGPRAAEHRSGGWSGLRGQLRPLAPLFTVQVCVSAVNTSLVFLLPDLLLLRGAPAWIAQGGGHFALVAGGCLSLLPAGYGSDRWGARRVLVASNAVTGLLLILLLLRPSLSPVDLLLLTGIGACNAMNNVVAVSEGNRLLPGQASGVSAMLMGLPWCIASAGPVIAGLLADPSRGGSPAKALAWFTVLVPLALGASLRVRSRRG